MDQYQNNRTEESDLRDELSRLQQERKDAIQGNMNFSFGYDPAVADLERQIAIVKARIWDSDHHEKAPSCLRRVIVCDEKTGESESFEVTSGQSGARNGCTIVNREAAFGYVLEYCSLGDKTEFGVVVSIDGSPELSLAEVAEVRRERSEAQKRAQQETQQRQRQAEEDIQQQRRALVEANEQRLRTEAEAVERQRIAQVERRKQVAAQNAKMQQEQQVRRAAWLEAQRVNAWTAPLLSLGEARVQVAKLVALGGSAVLEGQMVSDRAKVLLIHCRKGHDAASDAPQTGDGAVMTIAGVMGFLFGALVAGPAGAIVGAGIGAGVGGTHNVGSEKSDWAGLLSKLKLLIDGPL